MPAGTLRYQFESFRARIPRWASSTRALCSAELNRHPFHSLNTVQVEEALTEEARERTAVGDLREQLQVLQRQVQEAQERLRLTQARVEQNLNRVNELKAEAVSAGLAALLLWPAGIDRVPSSSGSLPTCVHLIKLALS